MKTSLSLLLGYLTIRYNQKKVKRIFGFITKFNRKFRENLEKQAFFSD
jgi:hypothetical protein